MNKYLMPIEFFDRILADFDKSLMGHSNFLGENSIYDRVENFPPSDVYIGEDKSLNFNLALAGIKDDEISVEFESDKMIVEVTPEGRDLKNKIYAKRGISYKKAKQVFAVPFSRYDVENAKASFENGMLEVYIPIRESAKPRKLTINSGKNDTLLNE